MDWGKIVRTLRTRLNMNQAQFARLTGVSQTYISRIESGRITPTDRVADAILSLSKNPRTRSVFDDFVAAVRYSPFIAGLVHQSGNDFRMTAMSESFSQRFGVGPGDLVEESWAGPLKGFCERMLEAGAFQGDVDSAECLLGPMDGMPEHVRMVCTPIRDESGAWHMHGTLRAIDEAEFQERRAAMGDWLAIRLRDNQSL